MKIQNKITLLFTVLSGMLILIFCAFLYFFVSRNVHEYFFHRLEVRSEIAAQTELQDHNTSEIYNEVKSKYLKNLPAEVHKKFEGVNNLEIARMAIASGFPSDFIDEAVAKGSSRYFSTDTFYVATFIPHNSERFLLISSAVDESGFEELKSLKKTIFVGFFMAIIAFFTIGKLFASTVFKPVREIIEKVNVIKASNLHFRLEQTPNKDEISDLIFTFNKMLARLETTFELQNNFISNASHELKTPLTIISGEAELALRDKQNSESVQQSLSKIVAESERLEQLMNSLLSLAQTGFDGKKLLLEKIRIDELILVVKIAANKIFPDNKIEINYDDLPDDEEKLALRGNPVTLKVALLNIFINACKYSGGQKVQVNVTTDENFIIVTVCDTGIGIPEEELSQIFVPFFRASNTENFKGYGIGLPLSLNIVKLHGGSIEASSVVNKGTKVTVRLPFLREEIH